MMDVLIIGSFVFVGFQLMNVLLNFLFREKILKTKLQNEEQISVLIPVRNEEANIGFLLEDLHKMKNDHLEIIVCDDGSTDNTIEVITHYLEKDQRIRLIHSGSLPIGWLGKNYACFNLAQQAMGKYLLFVDADVRLFGNIVVDAMLYLKRHKLGLLSFFPVQIQVSVGEKLAVPLMNYILLTLLPLFFVRISPFKSHAAANGQFMMFDALVYKELQPHRQFKLSAVEDIQISRFYKSRKVDVACIIGDESVQCRMYRSYLDALKGFSKNIFMFFGDMHVFAFLFWLCAVLGLVMLLFASTTLVGIYLFVIIVMQILYAYTCKQNPIVTLIFFPAHLMFMIQVMVNAYIVKKKKNYTWKERNIY